MKVYIPYYDRCYHILEADADKMRRIGKYWRYNGWIYGDTAYTTREAAEAYVNKKYHEAKKSEYKPMQCGTVNQ